VILALQLLGKFGQIPRINNLRLDINPDKQSLQETVTIILLER